MKKGSKILYLKEVGTHNTEFIEYLKKNYNTKVCNYVLSNIFESHFGHLCFDIEDINGISWGSAMQNLDSLDDIVYDYGFDFFSDNIDTRTFKFRHCLIKQFNDIGVKFTNKTKLKKILNPKKYFSKFIRENDIYKYDLIIVENLASRYFSTDKPIKTSKKKRTTEDYYSNFVHYKITPRILNKVLNSNSKIMFLMDYDYSSLVMMSESLIRYKKMLNTIGLSSFSLAEKSSGVSNGISSDILVGVDFENRIDDTLSKFNIIIEDKVKDMVSDKYSPLFQNVNNIFLNYPIQLNPDSKNNIHDKNKVILYGNNKTTKLYPGWDNEIYDHIKRNEIVLNIEKIVNPTEYYQIDYTDASINKMKEFKDIGKLKDVKHLEDFDCFLSPPFEPILKKFIKRECMFGIADTLYNSNYVILSGHICNDDFVTNKKCSNMHYIKNILKYLTSKNDSDLHLKKDFLPKIRMETKAGKVFINCSTDLESRDLEISLTKMEFCYFRYFLERAYNNLKFTKVVEESLKMRYIKDIDISSNIIRNIIDYYRETFPDSQQIRRLEEMYYKEERTPNVKQTFIPHVHRINKEITTKLIYNLSPKIIALIIISTKGYDENKMYGIKLPPENISII